MVARFLASLILAQSTASLLEEFVDVVANVEPASDGDGIDAFFTADDVVSSCYSSGVLAPTAAAIDAGRCLCCNSVLPISCVYSSCASYIANGLPDARTAFRGTSPTRTSTRLVTTTTAPAACTSVVDVYMSSEFQFETTGPSDVASCFW
ncbi:uncharacterized protein THITE_2147511 [Thermothielavioides terrestris NRRL 8126]|uniref:Secreted protein n=1 Tax=Thermothielavioides terrestris (strain ATCC 38088 / NRRL 8126) TaxID=578455 RepID=G2RDB0_THETT|nr:uncharacterized protein THITE_2147511 [Thermothielavioides terrestris NRRL 8126]AEO70749.1 hypothetical protein THITE_2147511 [Thermothielavioides terrestris NRRL 8126]